MPDIKLFQINIKRVFVLEGKSITIAKDFSRNVSSIDHQSIGDLEISINSRDDLEKAKPFILKS